MAKVGQSDILDRYSKADFKTLSFLTPIESLKQLFSEASAAPENHKNAEHDPNSIYIVPKKKIPHLTKGDSHGTHGHNTHNQEAHQQRQKVYKPGPFALFYKINEGKENRDDEVWYYKDHRKDIVGPVSSYNMDKMVFFKNVTDDTKVAFRSVDKFVKFKKIRAIAEEEGEKEA